MPYASTTFFEAIVESVMPTPSKNRVFGDYKDEGHAWITLASGEYYPDILPLACELYKPVLVTFDSLLKRAPTSQDLFLAIQDSPEQWMRIQLARVFKKYVSPETPVEMLKVRSRAQTIILQFGAGFRNIVEVQQGFSTRPMPDEALCAVLWEYKDRGKKGYDLTEALFNLLRKQLPHLRIIGPERAGKDVRMGAIFPDYPKPDRPVDFVAFAKKQVVAVGLARYDGDRGGAQEDDRTGQYREVAQELIGFFDRKKLPHAKVIFANDGPGLLLGTMWNDYAHIEALWPNRVKVVTLRMVQGRITKKWLES